MAEEQHEQSARVSFLKLIVGDLDASERFFRDAFGFTESRDLATQEFVERILTPRGPSLSLILLAWRDGRQISIGDGYGPIGITVDDLDASLARAAAAGAILLRGPIDAPAMRIAFMRTPDGHEIELLQRRTN